MPMLLLLRGRLMVCFYSNAFSLLQNYAGPEPVECGFVLSGLEIEGSRKNVLLVMDIVS
jgi:hypothetical protein